MIRWTIVTACIILLACGIPQPRPVPPTPTRVQFHVDTRMSPSQQEDILRAGRSWREFTKGNVEYSFYFDLDETTLLTFRDKPRMVLLEPYDDRVTATDSHNLPGYLTLGFTVIRPPPYWIGIIPARFNSPSQFYPVVLHELGHVARIGHAPTEYTAVMSFANPRPDFTAQDLELCKAAGACR